MGRCEGPGRRRSESGWDVAKYMLGHEREMISGMGFRAIGCAGETLKDRWPTIQCSGRSHRFDVDAIAFGRCRNASSTS